jgi:Fic family protein
VIIAILIGHAIKDHYFKIEEIEKKLQLGKEEILNKIDDFNNRIVIEEIEEKERQRRFLEEITNINDILNNEDQIQAFEMLRSPEPSRMHYLASKLLKIYPTSIAAKFALARSSSFLQGFYEAKELYEELNRILPSNQIILSELNTVKEDIKKFEKIVRDYEEKFDEIPEERIFHKWRPLEPLPSNLFHFKEDVVEDISSKWDSLSMELKTKGKQEKYLDRLKRLWAVETGRVEHLYNFSETGAEELINRGISREIIAREVADDVEQLSARDHELRVTEIEEIIDDEIRVIEKIFSMVKEEKEKKINLTLDFIFDIHDMFISSARYHSVYIEGQGFRKVLVHQRHFKYAPNSPTRKDKLIHQFCPPSKVNNEMEKLLKLFNEYESKEESINPIVLAAWLHHRFVEIHPFSDGNGRVSRTLASLILMKSGLLPFVVTLKDKPNYIRALDSANTGNLEPFIQYFIDKQYQVLNTEIIT